MSLTERVLAEMDVEMLYKRRDWWKPQKAYLNGDEIHIQHYRTSDDARFPVIIKCAGARSIMCC